MASDQLPDKISIKLIIKTIQNSINALVRENPKISKTTGNYLIQEWYNIAVRNLYILDSGG
ncbi:hypothetical protein NCCP133_00320 [Cytobacillus sp. NCCP-133]|nr:hypothetical protein NCCP133_00320 [Cytobacillus sp. NCCP-133]